VVEDLAPDVEALLVHRLGEARACYRVSIDHGLSLVGLVRASWRGLSGGPEVQDALRSFFAGLEGSRSHA
jgi:hypothetical protein